MGDVLIISQWHQEGTVGDNLRDCDDQGNWMALHEFYADRPDVPHEQMLAEHPDASFECAVPIAHTWILPPEPLRPHDWYRDPALVAAQNCVKRSPCREIRVVEPTPGGHEEI